MARISKSVLQFRERKRRRTMRPSTFAAIEREAAARGARDPEAVAGAAYWKTLAAQYRGNPSSVYSMAVHLGYPYLRGEGKVAEDGRTWLSRITKKADGSGPALFVGWDQATRKWVIEEEGASNPDLEKTGGLHIVYSPPNQAYFLMWHGSVLRIFPTKAEAKAEMDYLLRTRSNPDEPLRCPYCPQEWTPAEVEAGESLRHISHHRGERHHALDELAKARKAYESARTPAAKRAAAEDLEFWGGKAAAHAHGRGGNPDGRQLVGEHKGVEMYFEGISYNAPALKLYGYSTDLALMRAIDRKLKKRGGNPFDWREQRQHAGGESGILDSIRHGDKVTILTPQGQERTGRAVMRGPAGWVLNMGGAHGTPGIASERNIVKVRKANPSRRVFVFFDDSIGKYTAVTYHPKFGSLFMTGKTESAARRALRARVAQAERTGTHRNPDGELDQAAELYETFHGREPREILAIAESAEERGEYTALGDLVELTIDSPTGDRVKISFTADGVKVASSPEGTQLYLLGGNQDISGALGKFGADASKDLVDLGDVKQVVYEAAKWQTDFKPEEWKHDFGEDSGIRPRGFFDQLKRRVFFAGGTYRVERPGIVD
jgi:hypothetical protein